MEAIISVQLQDCPSSIEAQHQRQAEARFERELRKSFPNNEALKRAFKLFSDASEGGTISRSEEKVPALLRTRSHHQKHDEVAHCSDAVSYIDLDDHLHLGFHSFHFESPVATGR